MVIYYKLLDYLYNIRSFLCLNYLFVDLTFCTYILDLFIYIRAFSAQKECKFLRIIVCLFFLVEYDEIVQ